MSRTDSPLLRHVGGLAPYAARAVSTARRAARRVAHAVGHGARITWALFSVDNLSITLIPGALCTLSAWSVAGHRLGALAGVLAVAVVYFFLYGALAILDVVIAYRVARLRTPRDDHRTYLIYCWC